MTEIGTAVKKGNASLEEAMVALQGTFEYEETAYHLPVSFALTGRPVHDAEEARKAYSLTGKNPLVAAESIIASRTKTSRKGIFAVHRVYRRRCPPETRLFPCGRQYSRPRIRSRDTAEP